MKLVIFFIIFGIANARQCNYKEGKKTKNRIIMDFIETGGYNNFKSLKLTFPKLDQVFDCVTTDGDLVKVEILYKNQQGKFESIGKMRIDLNFRAINI